MVTQIAEGVRRYTAKKGREVNIAAPPLNYGGHPYHHLGMPGTIMLPQETVVETLIYVMLGLWNDGYRKQIIINNHGQLWMLETALHEFCKRFQLPGIFQVMDWHRAIREFFIPVNRPDSLETTFIHADESETAVGLLLFPDMIDMKYVKDERGKSFLPGGHFDTSVDPWRRPHRWSEGEGHVGDRTRGHPGRRRRRTVAGDRREGQAPDRGDPELPDLVRRPDPGRLSVGKAPADRPDHAARSEGPRTLPQGALRSGLEVGLRTALDRAVHQGIISLPNHPPPGRVGPAAGCRAPNRRRASVFP